MKKNCVLSLILGALFLMALGNHLAAAPAQQDAAKRAEQARKAAQAAQKKNQPPAASKPEVKPEPTPKPAPTTPPHVEEKKAVEPAPKPEPPRQPAQPEIITPNPPPTEPPATEPEEAKEENPERTNGTGEEVVETGDESGATTQQSPATQQTRSIFSTVIISLSVIFGLLLLLMAFNFLRAHRRELWRKFLNLRPRYRIGVLSGLVVLVFITSVYFIYRGKPPVPARMTPNGVPQLQGPYPLEVEWADLNEEQIETLYQKYLEAQEFIVLKDMRAKDGFGRYQQYKPLIDAAAHEYGLDPEFYGAQLLHESFMDAKAESKSKKGKVIAKGIAQFTESTARNVTKLTEKKYPLFYDELRPKAVPQKRGRRTVMVTKKVNVPVDNRDKPEIAIPAGAWLINRAMQYWGVPWLAHQEYHSGGKILKDWVKAHLDDLHPGWEKRYKSMPEALRGLDCTYAEILFKNSPVKYRKANAERRELMKGKHDFSAFYNLGNEGALKLLRLYLSNPKEFNRRADGYISLFNKYHFTTGNVPSRWCAWYGTDNKLWEDGYADCDALKRAVSKGELVELPNDPQRLGFFIDPDIGDRDGDHQFKHRAFYRTNTREAWGMALYVAYEYRRLLKAEKITFDPLKVAGAVRSVWYQNKLGTTAIPVHVAGLAIDFSYKDMTEEQKYRLKLLLDTLTNLGLLSFTDEENGNHFHVVVPKDKATREFYRGVYLKFFLN